MGLYFCWVFFGGGDVGVSGGTKLWCGGGIPFGGMNSAACGDSKKSDLSAGKFFYAI